MCICDSSYITSIKPAKTCAKQENAFLRQLPLLAYKICRSRKMSMGI